ncbi:hypothetical protein yc1106_06620 [Curvularia clavata]|uniref:Uncharacterized protein n=1 Tax=Curvularia clavata TaxID=95742 RepID=A0A9Q8ZA53_CURCL|nr:hypothetical protein yc1106_06620 [Curvularia clavata]
MSNRQCPQADAPPSTPTAPPSWSFAAQYAKPLPPSLQFDPSSGFGKMTDYLSTQLPSAYPTTSLKICPVVATYRTGAIKKAWVNQEGLSEEAKKEYACGATLSTAVKNWTQGGTVGVVTSSMSSASEQSQGFNDWHAVGMALLNDEVWVHDPAYDANDYTGKIKRVDGVNGTGMVHQLVQSWPRVRGVYFQGPPTSYSPNQMECMGRSAQWVEATVAGELPWPPNKDASGGV